MHQRSKLGNFLDRVKTSTLIYVLLLGVLLAAALFFFLTGINHGIESTVNKENEVAIWDAIYFSVVTVSSLGYGDFRPVGFGRIVAVLEVIYGLVFLAIIVSKLASERTSTLTKLVYASDTQRRLLEFIDSASERNEKLEEAIINHDYFSVSDLALQNKTAFTTYKHFINYHFQYGDIGNDWDARQMVRLMRASSDCADLSNKIIKQMHTDANLCVRISSYLKRIVTFSDHVAENYETESIQRLHENVKSQKRAFDTALKRCGNDFTKLRANKSNSPTEPLLKRVKDSLPKRPWPDQVHKLVAKDLRISNKLATRSISVLMERGHFPPPCPEDL